MENKKTMKSFDFPLIFRYIVGYLKIIQNKNKQKHQVRQHISLPNRYPPQRYNQQPNLHSFNQTKQYSFGKKRLIEIRYAPSQPLRLQTQGSETTQRKRTIFGDQSLRKMHSHRTQLTTAPTDDKNNDDKKSMKSLRSTMRNVDNNIKGNKMGKNSSNNASVLLQKKKQQSLINQTQSTRRCQLISNRRSSVTLSVVQSSKHICNNDDNANQPKLQQRLRTQIQPQDTNININQLLSSNNSNRNGEIKKMSNFTLRKQNGRKNLTKLNNRENQQVSFSNIGDGENDGQKTMKKKTNLFQVLDDFSQKTERGSPVKGCSKIGVDGGYKRQSKMTQFLQDANQRYLKRVSKRGNCQDNTFQTVDSQQNQSSDLQVQSQKVITIYQPFLRKASRLKTQKIFKKNIQIKKLKQKLKNEGYQEQCREQMGYAYNRKLRTRKSPLRNSNRIETNIFKKKYVGGENGAGGNNNSMVIRRIKKSCEQDIIQIQQQQYDLVPSSSNLSKKPMLFSKGNVSKQKPDTLNVFNELSDFHSMMQNIDGDGSDERLSQIVSSKMLNMNPFKLVGEDSNRIGEDFFSQRRKMFESDEKLFKLSKRVINKANQLKQVQVL